MKLSYRSFIDYQLIKYRSIYYSMILYFWAWLLVLPEINFRLGIILKNEVLEERKIPNSLIFRVRDLELLYSRRGSNPGHPD